MKDTVFTDGRYNPETGEFIEPSKVTASTFNSFLDSLKWVINKAFPGTCKIGEPDNKDSKLLKKSLEQIVGWKESYNFHHKENYDGTLDKSDNISTYKVDHYRFFNIEQKIESIKNSRYLMDYILTIRTFYGDDRYNDTYTAVGQLYVDNRMVDENRVINVTSKKPLLVDTGKNGINFDDFDIRYVPAHEEEPDSILKIHNICTDPQNIKVNLELVVRDIGEIE